MAMEKDLKEIASHFDTDAPVISVNPLGEGFINDTFVAATDKGSRYILQRKNSAIFKDLPAMMDNIKRVTDHLKRKISEAGGDPMREAMTIIPTRDGALYYKNGDDYWAMSLFIENTRSYTAATDPSLAYQGGKGIGLFQRLLSDFTEPLADILPGFHDMRFRLIQWDEAVKADKAGRVASLAEEIGWIEARRDRMMEFWKMVESGVIPRRVTHNDTKISNILFDTDGEVLCVIDLDTVLSATALNDFGDSIRSYANTGEEDDKNLDRVSMSLEMFRGYTAGYLSQAGDFLCEAERDNLAFSALFITYEQVLRFLMDYIDGDTYYRIKYPDHNLVRTHAQYKLLRSMEEQYEAMRRTVGEELSGR